MNIVKYWRQFGRRYFWPHLLLGLIAAGTSGPGTADTTLLAQRSAAVFGPFAFYTLSQERAAQTRLVQQVNSHDAFLASSSHHNWSDNTVFTAFNADHNATFQVSDWLARTKGIRAGPRFYCCIAEN